MLSVIYDWKRGDLYDYIHFHGFTKKITFYLSDHRSKRCMIKGEEHLV